MTKYTTAPYLFCRKSPRHDNSPICERWRGHYLWAEGTAAEVDKAFEISDLLLERLGTQQSFILTSLVMRQKILKISLEALDELNKPDHHYQICRVVEEIDHFLNFAPIGINFKEVFFVAEGENPPSHFRPGIDVCVQSWAEFKELTSKFSYQLGKAMINQFMSIPSPTDQNYTDALRKSVIGRYSTNPLVAGWDKPIIDFTTPLNKYNYFSSAMEALVHINSHRDMLTNEAPVVPFKNPVSISELKPFMDSYHFKELIFVFQDSAYEDEHVRQQFYEDVLTLAKDSHFLLHFILITHGDTDYNLQSLAPEKTRDMFSPLNHGAGYYLQSPHVFSLIYRNIQRFTSLPENWLTAFNDCADTHASSSDLVLTPNATYIIKQEADDKTRKSKALTQQELKNKAKLTITHQQELSHTHTQVETTQELSQGISQAQAQQMTHSEQRSMSGISIWEPTTNIRAFCNELEAHAKEILPNIARHEQLLEQAGYLTQFYRKHHSKRQFVEQLAYDESFRLRIAAKVYGMACPHTEDGRLSFSSLIHLPDYSIDNIRPATRIVHDLTYSLDGLLPSSCSIVQRRFWGRTLVWFDDKASSLLHYPFREFFFTSAIPYQNSETHDFQHPLHYFVLLTEESLSNLPIEQQSILIQHAESLLDLFKSKKSCSEEEIKNLETRFCELIKFYFPDQPDYLNRLEKFIANFQEHNEDNLKILVWILIRSHKHGMEIFLNLLSLLDARNLLDNFYVTHFKYAAAVSSVEKCVTTLHTFTDPIVYTPEQCNAANFIKLAALTPITSSANHCPAYVRFGHHFLMFAAKNNFLFLPNELPVLEQLFNRLYTKFLVYTGYQKQEAQEIMTTLVNNLIQEDGLTIAPLTRSDTFFEGLEKLLDHAIAKQVLKEQVAEIKGISFLWTDTAYAIDFNGFQVVCEEMDIRDFAIDPKTKRYSISKDELIKAICNHQPGGRFLKTALFRYLGTQAIREDINYYRQLFDQTTAEANAEETYIYELILAYFAVSVTGNHYQFHVDTEAFAKEFVNFLNGNKLNRTRSSELVSLCLHQFFSHMTQTQNDRENGINSLWGVWREKQVFAFVYSKKPIPSIFLRKFECNKLGQFLLKHTDLILADISSLKQEPDLAYSLIESWLSEKNLSGYEQIALGYLIKLYPDLSMRDFLQNITKIAAFIESITALIQISGPSLMYLQLDDVIEQSMSLEAAVTLIELLSQVMSQNQQNETKDKSGVAFLFALSTKPSIIARITTAKPLLALALEFYFATEVKDPCPEKLLTLCERLMSLELNLAVQTFTTILTAMGNSSSYEFFTAAPHLTALQLNGIAQFIQACDVTSIAIEMLKLCLEADNNTDFSDINRLLNNHSPEEVKRLLSLTLFICTETTVSPIDQLIKLKAIPLNTLKQLTRFRELFSVGIEDFLAILASPSIPDAITQFERATYTKNMERYEYNREEVLQKIGQIQLLSSDSEDDRPLGDQTQSDLLNDYETLMSYMTQKPVLVEEDEHGVRQSFTIHDLNESQFKTVYKCLKQKLKKEEDRHPNQLLLIALCCEALYRTTKKFPRSTQILVLLNSLRQTDHLIQEVKTGEGKSIIAALQGAEGRTVDIVTENNQLAKDGLNQFRLFYLYLGIACGTEIIHPQSNEHDYIEDGINYSTASNLSLFRAKMQLEKKKLPSNSVLVCDEIDATLTTTVQFRLAANLNPILNDKESCIFVCKTVLDFVQEKEIFRENQCSKEEDIHNLRNYFILKNPGKRLLDLVNKLNDELLETLLESAMTAHELEENIDYMVITHDKQCYAAPIISSTKRPDAQVSYSDWVQQLLHTRLNQERPQLKYKFFIEPNAETLIVVSAKNFFDYYRMHHGRIIGLTGTGGAPVERTEFHQQQGLVVYRYPAFHEECSQNLGLRTAFGIMEQFELIYQWIQEHKQQHPAQPILIINNTAQATLQLRAYLASRTNWTLQNYNGYEQAGKSEDEVVYLAGKDHMITNANQSLTRGADISPTYEQGLMVINTCVDLTPSELRQIQGRAARNGKPGQFISILNAAKLGTPSDTPETLLIAFQNHQHSISLKQQQERSKLRLLENVRHIIISDLLNIRACADKILSKQYGQASSLVDTEQFMKTLAGLNHQAEKHYTELLDQHGVVEGDAADEFLAARIAEYQAVLNRWLPDERFRGFKVVEPLVPIETLNAFPQLNALQADQLSAFADVFHTRWVMDGHQQTQENIRQLEQFIVLFKPYFEKRCSFKQALGQLLEQEHLLAPEVIEAGFNDLEKNIHEMIDYCQSIPVLGRYVPVDQIKTFIADYFKTTKEQICEKKWDEVDFPKPDLSGITTWVNGLSTVLSALSIASTASSLALGGPIPLVVNRLIMPTVLGWLKNKLKQQFANSESNLLQIIIGLDDGLNDLSKAITSITSLNKNQELSVRFVLENVGSLAKNKALLKGLIKYFELTGQNDWIPYLEVIPQIIELLTPYQDLHCRELLKPEILMSLFHEAVKSPLILKAFEESGYKQSLMRFMEVKPETLSAVGELSFAELLNLIKVIAHPNFFALMNKLPPETTLTVLNQWLSTESHDLPHEVQEALVEFKQYQTNRERIEEESKRTIIELKDANSLTMDKLKTKLASLSPKRFEPEEKEHVEDSPIPRSASYREWLRFGAVCVVTSVVVTYTILFFTPIIALASTLLIGSLLFPVIKSQISTLANLLREEAPERNTSTNQMEATQLSAPVFISYNKQTNRTAQENTSETTVSSQRLPQRPRSPEPMLSGYNHHGLFANRMSSHDLQGAEFEIIPSDTRSECLAC